MTGGFKLLVLTGYLGIISQMKDVRRVFQYHGAEHKTIAAYENGVELTPETAQQFSTAHVRCGTNFLCARDPLDRCPLRDGTLDGRQI